MLVHLPSFVDTLKRERREQPNDGQDNHPSNAGKKRLRNCHKLITFKVDDHVIACDIRAGYSRVAATVDTNVV